MIIRDYNPKDELAWLRCRLMAFLDCSYFDDVKRKKDVYENPSINLVAEKDSQIVGFIDIEYQPEKSATIWDLGVLPEYRCLSIATKLFNEAKARLLKLGVKRIEVWTQDDIEANNWYLKQGFINKFTYLNCFADNNTVKEYVNYPALGKIYGIREFNFEASIERKAELENKVTRLHEVRMYELLL